MKSQGLEATEERPFMLGIRWMSFGGRSGWFHTWSDGTAMPVLSGHDDDGDKGGKGDADGDDGDDGDDDGDEEDDDDDDDGDDGDDGKNKPKDSKRVKELSDENAKWRNKHKARIGERDEARTKLTAAEAKIAKLEKDGTGDEALKARVTELEGKLKTAEDERDELKSDAGKAKVRDQVAAAVKKLKIADEVPYVMYILNEGKQIKVDDDGDVEELDSILKKHLKDKTFEKVASGDEEDDSTDDDGVTSGARRTRSKSSKRKVSSQGLDRATLEAKYPALRR